MLDALFGEVASRVLLFLQAFNSAYAGEIAEDFTLSLSAVQRQLARLERAGVLVSRLRGKVRLYEWNPRHPFRNELRALLSRAISYMPEEDRLRYLTSRTRPRRSGKPD